MPADNLDIALQIEALRMRGASLNQADWDKISELLGGLRQELPENAFCLEDYAQQFNLPHSTAVGDLEKLVKQGKLETMIHYSSDSRRSRRWCQRPLATRAVALIRWTTTRTRPSSRMAATTRSG